MSAFTAVVPLAREADVDAVVVRRPGQRLELGEDLGRPLALRQPQVEQEEPGREAVALGNVHPEAEAARLLPADDGLRLGHLRPDVLEADAGLVRLRAEDLGQALRHAGGGDGVDRRADQAAHLEQVPVQQAVDLQLVDEDALLGRHADPIRVAIEGDPDVGAPARDLLQPLVDVGADRLGVDAAEERVALGVELADRQAAVAERGGCTSRRRSRTGSRRARAARRRGCARCRRCSRAGRGTAGTASNVSTRPAATASS